MSSSNPDLIPLIYRHLKEHGFQTAAEELQKQSLQGEAPSSASLLDIYSSWLKSSKRKTKRSTPDKKKTAPKKAAQKKKIDKTTKQTGSPNKKSPAKLKKGGVKTNVKSSESKTNTKKADEGEDSDSDSSLDVEKWKKLVEQMTDSDLAKVEALNALAAPEPKKPRVRKSRAKPKPKPETPTNGQEQQSKTPDKSTEDILAKSNPIKKSRSKKVVSVAALDSTIQEQNVEIPVANDISTPKPRKEKKKATTDPTAEPTAEPKRKKKKIATPINLLLNETDVNDLVDNNNDAKTDNLSEMRGSQESTSDNQTKPKKSKKKDVTINASGGEGLIDKEIDTNKAANPSELTENTANIQTEPKKKKKKKAIEGNVEELADSNVEKNTVEDLNGNPMTEDSTSSLNATNAESIGTVKKKKKKKDKAKEDGEQTVTEAKDNSVTSEETCEKTVEESSQDTEEMAPKKKKKKKDKSKEEPQPMQEDNVIVETVEENTLQTIVEKNPKKKKKEGQEHLGTQGEKVKTMTQDSDGKIQEEALDPVSTPQTAGSKKKKHKLQKEELAQADTASQIQEETPKKKKKKSSKSKENES